MGSILPRRETFQAHSVIYIMTFPLSNSLLLSGEVSLALLTVFFPELLDSFVLLLPSLYFTNRCLTCSSTRYKPSPLPKLSPFILSLLLESHDGGAARDFLFLLLVVTKKEKCCLCLVLLFCCCLLHSCVYVCCIKV